MALLLLGTMGLVAFGALTWIILLASVSALHDAFTDFVSRCLQALLDPGRFCKICSCAMLRGPVLQVAWVAISTPCKLVGSAPSKAAQVSLLCRAPRVSSQTICLFLGGVYGSSSSC